MTTLKETCNRLMETMRVPPSAKESMLMILCLLVLSFPVLATGSRVPPVEPAFPVLILEVFANLEARTIEIHGDGFGINGSKVTLGYHELAVNRSSNATISARLPQRLRPGTYMLTVERPEAWLDCEVQACSPPAGLYVAGGIGTLGVTIGSTANSEASQPRARYGQPAAAPEYLGNLQLALGEIAAHEDLKIEFAAVVEDSRCPIDVTCIWAGRVVVALRLGQGEFHLTLGEGPLAAQLSAGGHLIELVQVLPVPSTQSTNGSLKYEIDLVINEGPMCEGGVHCPPIR